MLIPVFHMAKDNKLVKAEGVVEEKLPAATFRARLDDGKELIAHLSGKMRMHHIKIVPGDKVLIELSGFNDDRGRIIRRL